MKTMKRLLCLALVLSVVFAMTGCNKSNFSPAAVRKYAKAEHFDECDDPKDFYKEVGTGRNDANVYVTATKRDAKDLFNTVIYRLEPDKPKYKFTEVTALYTKDDDGFCMIVAATFEDREDAEKFFKKYSKSLDYDNEDKGDEKSYSYFIANYVNSNDKNVAVGLYMSGNTVIWLRTTADDCDVAEEFCKRFKLISPLEA